MKKLIFIMGLLLIIPIVYSAPLPSQSLNPYYKELFADWLNGTIDTTKSGSLQPNLNASFYDLNATNSLIVIGNVNITLNLNVSGEIYLRGQSVQIEATALKRENITEYLGGGGANDSLVRNINLSSVVRTSDAFNDANNGTKYVKGVDIGFVNLSRLGSLDINTSGSLNVSGASRFNSVYALSYDISWTNLTNYPVACPAGTFVTQIDDSITCTSVGTSAYFVKENLTRLGNVDINTSGSLNVSGQTLLAISSGNVGIGTTNPTQILQIEGTNVNEGGNFIFIRHKNQGAEQGIFIGQQNASNDLIINQSANNAILFGVGGTTKIEAMRITNTGNVGIGTTSPGMNLHVSDTGVNSVRIDCTSAGDDCFNLYLGSLSTTANSAASVNFIDAGGQTSSAIRGTFVSDANNEGQLSFFTRPSGGTDTERVTITSAGNVGIGTTNPTAKLDVSATSINVANFSSTSSDATVKIKTVSTGHAKLEFEEAGATGWSIGRNADDKFYIANSQGIGFSNDRLVIDTSGNVGIGTTTPASTLTIAGNFSATGTKSAVVNTTYGMLQLYAIESPEVRFFDENTANLINGFANISLEPKFKETIENNYVVYVTANQDSNGLYVAERTQDYFIVRENKDGKSNIQFSYLISAYRKGYLNTRLNKVAENYDDFIGKEKLK